MKKISKKCKIILAIVLAVLALTAIAVFAIRFFSGDEDAWICESGGWVKHGNPSAEMPTSGCGLGYIKKEGLEYFYDSRAGFGFYYPDYFVLERTASRQVIVSDPRTQVPDFSKISPEETPQKVASFVMGGGFNLSSGSQINIKNYDNLNDYLVKENGYSNCENTIINTIDWVKCDGAGEVGSVEFWTKNNKGEFYSVTTNSFDYEAIKEKLFKILETFQFIN